jgi:hypothetical protein
VETKLTTTITTTDVCLIKAYWKQYFLLTVYPVYMKGGESMLFSFESVEDEEANKILKGSSSASNNNNNNNNPSN